MRAHEQAGIKPPPCCTSRRLFGVGEGLLAGLDLKGGRLVGGDRCHDLRLQLRGLLFGLGERLACVGDCAESPAKGDLDRLRARKLHPYSLNLSVQPSGDVCKERISRELRLCGKKTLELALERLNAFRADQGGLARTRGTIGARQPT
jgi:hypothetical protein